MYVGEENGTPTHAIKLKICVDVYILVVVKVILFYHEY